MQNTNGKTALGLESNLGALLCYLANFIPCCVPLGLLYSIMVVVQDKTNKLPRFHAFQSILLSAVGIVISIVIGGFNGVAVASRSTVLSFLVLAVAVLLGLPLLIAVVYTAIKAYQGEIFKLPVIGDLADQWSN